MSVEFYSRKLKDAQTRYSATKVECLAIIKSIEYFSVYVIGKQFTIIEQSARHLNSRLTRWALKLQTYLM